MARTTNFKGNPKNLVGGMYLGSDDWIAVVRKRIELKPRSNEHPRAQILIGRASMASVVAGVAETLAIEEDRVRHGPDRLRTVRSEIVSWMLEHEWDSLTEMRGNMSLERIPDPAAYERANFRMALR